VRWPSLRAPWRSDADSILMSPPEQNAFSPAPVITMTPIELSFSACSTASRSSLTFWTGSEAAASFSKNPAYFDPLNIIELALAGECNAVATTPASGPSGSGTSSVVTGTGATKSASSVSARARCGAVSEPPR